jgi:hypothetical protein
MKGRHARVASRRARRRARNQVDPYDTETVRLFADMNRPSRIVQHFVGSTITRTRSIPAAFAVASLIRAYAARTQSGDTR